MVEALPERPFSGRRRAIPLAASGIFIAAPIAGLGLIVQLFLKDQGASTFVISTVSTLSAAGILLGGWLWGTVSDHVRRRPLLALLAAGLAVSIAVLIVWPSVTTVLPATFFQFLVFSGFGAVSIAIVSAASRDERRGKNLSYIASSRSLGFALGNVGAGVVLQLLGFRLAFVVSAALPLAALALLGALPTENPIQLRNRAPTWRTVFAAGLGSLYVATMLRQMSMYGAFALLYVYMDSIGIAPSFMGAIGASNTATQVLALLLFGWLADRIGRRCVFLLGFVLSVATPLLFVFASNACGMVIGYVTLGLSFSSMYVGATAHIGDRVSHEEHGQMLGLYESSRGLGGVFGPLIAGAVAPAIGFHGMFLVMAGIAALGLVVVIPAALRRPGRAIS